MRKTLSILGCSAVFSLLAFAGTWSGKLLDAKCYDRDKKAAGCAATRDTTDFALDVAGKIYRFDDSGNSKASAAMKNRADRSADPAHPQTGDVSANVKGVEQGETIKVESIDVK